MDEDGLVTRRDPLAASEEVAFGDRQGRRALHPVRDVPGCCGEQIKRVLTCRQRQVAESAANAAARRQLTKDCTSQVALELKDEGPEQRVDPDREHPAADR